MFITRLPTALSVLFGCLLIYWLLRRMSASAAAALFGAALLLACPLVIRTEASVSAELPLAMLLFLAFCLWWDGQEKGSMSAVRWVATGAVLLLAFSLQGPQPSSSTFVSAGAPGAVMQILGDAFPAAFAAIAYLLARGYGVDGAPGAGFVRPGFMWQSHAMWRQAPYLFCFGPAASATITFRRSLRFVFSAASATTCSTPACASSSRRYCF